MKRSDVPPEFSTEENFKKSTDFWLTELGRP
ncbi:MAG: hypothetical protein HW414_1731 [Dehalococcoidia bacterium]|nr:hypothetical protein [Dehalococcoidia bacterium]